MTATLLDRLRVGRSGRVRFNVSSALRAPRRFRTGDAPRSRCGRGHGAGGHARVVAAARRAGRSQNRCARICCERREIARSINCDTPTWRNAPSRSSWVRNRCSRQVHRSSSRASCATRSPRRLLNLPPACRECLRAQSRPGPSLCGDRCDARHLGEDGGVADGKSAQDIFAFDSRRGCRAAERCRPHHHRLYI